jgi:uncharacterized LabA/DUF88 family protein
VPGVPSGRLVVFLDYQNVYSGARYAFHPYHAAHTDGQIDPARLAELLASKGIRNRELTEIRIYRGRPDTTRDPVGYGANLRQCTAWERSDARIRVITRTLRYPRNWPQEPAQEKGIDVALAIDVATMAIRGEYDIAIVMSTDTDLKPALEAVTTLSGNPYPRCEVAAWSSPEGHSRRLSISGKRLWCHWLDGDDYRNVADPTDYTLAQNQ